MKKKITKIVVDISGEIKLFEKKKVYEGSRDEDDNVKSVSNDNVTDFSNDDSLGF
jgi:predicted Ser/Thr protein kinase